MAYAQAELPRTHSTYKLTAGSTWLAIWRMSWPLTLNMGTLALANFVEMWISGHLGTDAIAGVGISGQLWYFMMMMTLALSAGTTAIVSRYWGARQFDSAILGARHSLIFAIIFGTASALVGLLVCRTLIHALGATAGAEEQGFSYLRFLGLANIPYTVVWISNSIMRATGDARTPMVTAAVIALMVVLLDMVLCIWPFHIGVSGCGISWLVASLLGLVLNLFVMRNSPLKESLNIWPEIRRGISRNWFARLMNIGIPACVQDLSLAVSSFGVLLVLSHTAAHAVGQAAWSMGWRVEEVVSLMPMYAYNMAAATLIGQNLGARRRGRAELIGWQIALVGLLQNGLVAAVMILGADQIAQLMCPCSSTAPAVAEYLRILGYSEPLLAVWLVLTGAMQGAGYTQWPMLITVICFDVLRPLLALVLAVNCSMNAQGVWYGMLISNVVAGALIALQFRRGKWKSQPV